MAFKKITQRPPRHRRACLASSETYLPLGEARCVTSSRPLCLSPAQQDCGAVKNKGSASDRPERSTPWYSVPSLWRSVQEKKGAPATAPSSPQHSWCYPSRPWPAQQDCGVVKNKGCASDLLERPERLSLFSFVSPAAMPGTKRPTFPIQLSKTEGFVSEKPAPQRQRF
jgi:hypothetical protein